jgi:hypothetical protein
MIKDTNILEEKISIIGSSSDYVLAIHLSGIT